MRSARAIRRVMIGLALCVALIFLGVFVVGGAVTLSMRVIPLVNIASAAVIAFCVVVLLPLSIFKATRKFSSLGFLVASFLLGVTVWIYGLQITDATLGSFGTVIGLLLGIVGVIPLGIAAAGYKGLWFFVVELGFGLILTFAAYAFALYLAGKMDRAAIEEAPILP